jgi:hypothetical protein
LLHGAGFKADLYRQVHVKTPGSGAFCLGAQGIVNDSLRGGGLRLVRSLCPRRGLEVASPKKTGE